MPLQSLIYVSDSTLSAAAVEGEIDAIIQVARSRNGDLAVTGALMFTHSNFVQVLEGSPTALDELMASIKRDSRHENVRVLEVEALTSRRFTDWAMAYVGPASLVEPQLAPLVKADGKINPFATQEMISLLQSLVSLGQ
ncbi:MULTISPECIES: BLUF domain-containing protein [Sphingobium]|uniref:BLUF domain-containing protein n=1 Tax=Sphingobium tyrosinilyticum TaxID=2715436 RepID=A0ABV9F0Q2_9SPHN|nr:Photoactivated adenylate cyclase subunit beta-like protein FB [Sphingobium sp. EP60837]